MAIPTDFFFDHNLHEVPSNPQALHAYVKDLQSSLVQESNLENKVRMMGQIGVWLRILGDLEAAEIILKQAVQLIEAEKLGFGMEVQQKIRLANVLQWKRQFNVSNILFTEIIEKCRVVTEAYSYLPFALQHAGKNLFDQDRFSEALELFFEALELRKQANAPLDQIQSTEFAILMTKKRLGH